MDFQMFQKHACRTVNTKLTIKQQCCNLGLGIIDEIGETHEAILLDSKEKVCEEVGDVFWYIANLCTMTTIDFSSLLNLKTTKKPKNAINEAYLWGSKIAGIIKKFTSQGHDLNVSDLQEWLRLLFNHLVCILQHYGLTTKEVMEYNHMKLMKRYPNGFEVAKSVNRDE